MGKGKMGREVERIALERGHEIAEKNVDVWIDFSHPDAVLKHVAKAVAEKKPLILGTTGWNDQIAEVRSLVEKGGIGVCFAPNFSLGVHLFMQIVREAAKLIDPHGIYDVSGSEIHHKEKVDSPSGTAKALAKIVVDSMESRNKKPLEFASTRVGYVPGTHSVIFDSPVDSITLTHQARNRSGFALGAILAAETIGTTKGLIPFEELIGGKSLYV